MSGDLWAVFPGQRQLDKEDILGKMNILIAFLILSWRRPAPLSLGKSSRAGVASCCLVVFCWPNDHQCRMQKKKILSQRLEV